jgi:hypothetical protein
MPTPAAHTSPAASQVPETKGLTLEELNGEDLEVDPVAIAAGNKDVVVDAV